MKEIDARGLACPQPVLNARKALDEHDSIVILVDSTTAVENLRRMASSLACGFELAQQAGGYRIMITKTPATDTAVDDIASYTRCDVPAAGPTVVVLSGNTMGRGDDELGSVLIRSFVHTLAETARPDILVLYNTGVKLAARGADTAPDLAAMETAGTRILVCGTCINYFDLAGALAAGTVSNMYDITETMLGAGRLLNL